MRREPDIAIGNVIGSNMFNMLAVPVFPRLIAPGTSQPDVLQRDFPAMLVLYLALFGLGYGFHGPGRLTRREGAILLLEFLRKSFLYLSSR